MIDRPISVRDFPPVTQPPSENTGFKFTTTNFDDGWVAVALSDLTVTWIGGDNVAANYYNSVTGNYAGMGFVSMSDKFSFSANGDYVSKHSGASGMVGSMTTYNQEYKGKATVTNWKIILPNRWKGATDTFEAWFEFVNGGRILQLVNKQSTGIKYALVKKIKE